MSPSDVDLIELDTSDEIQVDSHALDPSNSSTSLDSKASEIAASDIESFSNSDFNLVSESASSDDLQPQHQKPSSKLQLADLTSISQQAAAQSAHRDKVLAEIVSSERSYVGQLQSLVERYLQPLQDEAIRHEQGLGGMISQVKKD